MPKPSVLPSPLLSSISCALALLTAPAVSQAGLLGFDIQAGIDKGTIKFLNAYPANVREQFLLAVNGGLGRFDSSVDHFFAQTNKLLEQAQDTTKCMSDQVGNIPKGWLEGVAGIDPKVAKELNSDLANIREDFHWRSNPREFRQAYADFDAKSSKAHCLTASGDLLRPEIIDLRNEARTSYILWARLDGQCTDSVACYAFVNSNLKDNLALALKQDKDKINADARYSSITPPPPKKGIFDSYDWKPYQESLIALLRLNDELALVAKERTAEGQAKFSAFQMALNGVNEKLARGKALANSKNASRVTEACNVGFTVNGELQSVSANLAIIERYEVLSAEQLAYQKAALADAQSTVNSLKSIKTSSVRNNGDRCEEVIYIPPTPNNPDTV